MVVDRAAGKIYWANATGNKISWAKLDGSGGGDLNTGTATVMTPIGVAIDTAAKKIYWANYGGNKISFARLDNGGGGDLNIIGTTVSAAVGRHGRSVDARVFWGNFQTNALDFAGLDGTGGGILATPGAAQLGPMPGAIDPDTGRIYWTNWNTPRGIMSAKQNGTGGGGTLYPSPGDARSPCRPCSSRRRHRRAGDHGARVDDADDALVLEGSWAADLLGELLYRAPRTFTYQWTFNGRTSAVPLRRRCPRARPATTAAS